MLAAGTCATPAAIATSLSASVASHWRSHAGSAPIVTAAATACVALPRLTAPGNASVMGIEKPSGPWMSVSSNHHCGVGRLKSIPVEYQSRPSRTMISPERGQLTESLAQLPPAAIWP